MYDSKDYTVAAVARSLGVSRTTVYRCLARRDTVAPGTAELGERRRLLAVQILPEPPCC
jgi:transposase-like protein